MGDRDVKSLAELLAEPPRRGDWGGWRVDMRNLALYLPRDPERPADGDLYWLELSRCTTSAGVLDWVLQIATKGWATDRVIAGLVRAFDDLLDPQANLCSHGLSKTLRPDEIRERVREVAQWPGPDEVAEPLVSAVLRGHQLVVVCPWCGREHAHGAGSDPDHPAYGHRVAHCGGGLGYHLVPAPEVG